VALAVTLDHQCVANLTVLVNVRAYNDDQRRQWCIERISKLTRRMVRTTRGSLQWNVSRELTDQ